jgi:hypothetical protein
VSDPLALLGDEVGVELRRGPTIRQHVAVELGTPVSLGETTRWPLSWQPVGHNKALPAFAGTLEIAEHDGESTTLQVTGGYHPPLGLVGIIVDGAIGHRLAEASIEHFVAGLARRLDRASVRREEPWRGPERAPDLRPA